MSETATRPVIPAGRYRQRLADAQALTRARGLDALLVGVGSDLRYLTGYAAMPLERLTLLVVPPAGPCRLAVPRLEADPARRSPAVAAGHVELVTWEETERPHELVAGLAGGGRATAVAVSDGLPARHLLRLQAALPGARFELGSAVTGALRVMKDADEIELLRLAARAADRALLHVAYGPLVGRTEAEVAREIEDRLVAEGHDSAEFAIVAAGPDAASPHHEPGEHVIRAGEPVVLDIGGRLAGYGSDVTRTLWVTGGTVEPDPAFVDIARVVLDAQARATAAVRPGAAAGELDALARATIAEAGFGEAFVHRLGHGIGLDGHEEPYLVAGNAETIRPGMAFSIEPGIYLDGRYGCRFEDIVICGEDGAIVLDEAPHELLVVRG